MSVKYTGSTVMLQLLALVTVILTPTACARAAGNVQAQPLRSSTVSIRIATKPSAVAFYRRAVAFASSVGCCDG